MKLNESPHFVPKERIPIIDASSSFLQVYQQLSASGHGGFLMDKGNRADAYVKAYDLADAVLQEVQHNPEKITDITSKPIGEVIAALPGTAANFLVSVDPVAVDVDYDEHVLQNQKDKVFRVIASGRTDGWFLNHERLHGTLTRRTIFLCEAGHRNPDPDHGTCYSCPSPIVKTIVE